MAELADALDSGSSGHCARAGSSPVIRSIAEETIEKIGGLFLFSEGSPYLREWIVFLGGTNFKKGVDKLFLIRYYSQAY